MKNSLLYSAFILISAISVISAQGTWTRVAPYPPRFHAYSAVEVGDKLIFWCGSNNTFTTTDLGNTFTEFPPNVPTSNAALDPGYVQGIAFADSLTGTIVTGDHEYRTSDGGDTWSLVSPAEVWINENIVCYGNSSVGWKFGAGGAYKTTDAGSTWIFNQLSFWNSGAYSCAYAMGADKVWLLMSELWGDYTQTAIHYSSNGGKNWLTLNTGLISDSLHQVTYIDFKMRPSGIGFASGKIYYPSTNSWMGFIERTADFGSTWDIKQFPDIIFNNLTCITDSIWISFGNSASNNLIYQVCTYDAGKTLDISTSKLYYSEYYNYCYSSIYSSKYDAVIVSTADGLYKSLDKGITYTKLTSDRDKIIVNLGIEKKPSDPSRQIIMALSYDQTYLISSDAGKSWQLKTFPYSYLSNYSQISIVDGVIYLIPDQSHLYKSTDNGENWSIIPILSNGAILSMSVLSKDTLFMQTYPWTSYSTDGGIHWIKSPFPMTYWLNQSSIIDGNNIIAVGGMSDTLGNGGIIYHSSNGGRNWRIIQTPYEMKYVAFSTNKLGTAVSDYNVYNTTDGGNSWKPILNFIDYQTSYSAIAFNESLHGFIRVGDNFLESSDGGITWKNSNLSAPLYGYITNLAIGSNGNIYAVGSGSLCMYVPDNSLGSSKNKVDSDSISDYKQVQLNNFPNPFNPATIIEFNLPFDSFVSLKIYNILGKEIETLANDFEKKGDHRILFDASNFSSGIYFAVLRTPGISKTIKLMLVK